MPVASMLSSMTLFRLLGNVVGSETAEVFYADKLVWLFDDMSGSITPGVTAGWL